MVPANRRTISLVLVALAAGTWLGWWLAPDPGGTVPPQEPAEVMFPPDPGPADSLRITLANDLATHPELIPHEPVMGGTMRFVSDEVRILTRSWVLAGFEDGHIHGWALLEHTQEPNGDRTWRVLQSYLD